MSDKQMTGRERMIAALKRQPIVGRPPHFELVFFLTMEAFGKVHPSHRYYEQWNQMSAHEQRLQLEDMASCYILAAERYHHDALFVHPNPWEIKWTKALLEIIRERTGDQYYIMMHGDPTLSIPDGEHMMEMTIQMYEEPEKLHEQSKRNFDDCMERAQELQGTGLLDGFTLCSDYAFNVNPFFSPEQFAEFEAPYLKDIITEYHKMGYYCIKHTDGNINPIVDQIVNCGPDALHSIDPQGGMSLSGIRAKYHDRIATVGNVNCGLLQTGTQEEADADTRRALHEGMDDGYWGYIFSTSNCAYTGLPLERYERMVDIWWNEGIYGKRGL